MRWRTIQAGIVMVMLCFAYQGAGSSLAAANARVTLALPNEGGVTPVARAGSPRARRAAVSRGQLRGKLRRHLSSVGGGSGVWVSHIGTGRAQVLFADAAKRRRLLASNTKLFATAAFLDRFGAREKLTTSLWASGRRTGRRDQILRGNLVLVGAGDPTLARPSFARRHGLPLTEVRPLAQAVREAGIRRVRGDIKADPSIFDGRRSVPQPGITGGPWLGPLSGLSYDFGYDGARFAANPALIAADALARKLDKVGVALRGRVRVGRVAAKRDDAPLAQLRSPSAAALAATTNTTSNNFFAEMLLKRLAARPGRPGTTARGARKAERFARSAGSGVSMVNGSGLSRTNVASPKEVGKLLVHMARDTRIGPAFRDSLAVAGRTGTLASRMRGTAAQGRCRGKTGTIDGVSALSGYCDSRAGLVVFSILMNGVNIDAARRAQDAMAAAIARYR